MSNVTHCSQDVRDLGISYTQYHGVTSLLVCLFGSVANLINITILSRKEMSSPTNSILVGLAMADLLVMLEYIPFVLHRYIEVIGEPGTFGWAIFVLVHSLFSQICHTVSIFLTILLAVWRYLIVAHPHRSVSWCQPSRTQAAIIFSYVLGVVVCIPIFFQYDLIKKDNSTIYVVKPSDNEVLQKVTLWMYGVIIKLIPCLALTVLSQRLIATLMETKRRRRHLMSAEIPLKEAPSRMQDNGEPATPKVTRKEKRLIEKDKQTDRTTRMLLAVLFLFIITELPQGVFGLLSGLRGDEFFHQCYNPLGDIFDILALINSSINFILYCLMSRQFRSTFVAVFVPKKCLEWLRRHPPFDRTSTETTHTNL